MAITKADVHHIARLARIALSAREETALEQELSGILDFIAELNAVDTAAAEPLTGGTDLVNSWRDDAPPAEQAGDPAALIAAAPEHRDGYIAVRAVFDRA
ncbi:Asp-tRNA(Asn)/Glu-tRNA(Gln) amidotransferase subunit GatC [Candidatus Parcubacteria bacterium]|nr:MAG: Asp-tRNA(Asn)/Glu-tRNA(Gln) amidotransferase subunit GatC [Candidatus Parcubacteria bacterium]